MTDILEQVLRDPTNGLKNIKVCFLFGFFTLSCSRLIIPSSKMLILQFQRLIVKTWFALKEATDKIQIFAASARPRTSDQVIFRGMGCSEASKYINNIIMSLFTAAFPDVNQALAIIFAKSQSAETSSALISTGQPAPTTSITIDAPVCSQS